MNIKGNTFLITGGGTKAGLHSFAISLSHQLQKINILVFELIHPMTDTELGGKVKDERGVQNRGIKPKQVAIETIDALKKDIFEIAVTDASNLVHASKNNFEQVFDVCCQIIII